MVTATLCYLPAKSLWHQTIHHCSRSIPHYIKNFVFAVNKLGLDLSTEKFVTEWGQQGLFWLGRMCFDQKHLWSNVIFDQKLSKPTQKLIKMQLGWQALLGTKEMHEIYNVINAQNMQSVIFLSIIMKIFWLKIIDQLTTMICSIQIVYILGHLALGHNEY